MTSCTRGFHAMRLDTGPWSFKNVTKTICTFQIRVFGPLRWTTCGQPASKRFSSPDCPVPRPTVYFIWLGTRRPPSARDNRLRALHMWWLDIGGTAEIRIARGCPCRSSPGPP